MRNRTNKLDRRQFLGTSAVSLLAAGTGIGCAEKQSQRAAAASGGSPFDRPLGFQSYGVRGEIEKDFTGTMERVHALGYASVEMCSPRGNYYRTAGYGNLTDLPPEEIKRQIEGTGLVCKSAHFEPHEVVIDDPARSADYAAALGLEYMVMSGSTVPDDGTVDDIKRWADIANRAAEVVKAAGLQLGYHNHLIGPQVEGRPQFEYIMEALDPNLVKMQFQRTWSKCSSRWRPSRAATTSSTTWRSTPAASSPCTCTTTIPRRRAERRGGSVASCRAGKGWSTGPRCSTRR